MNKSNEHPKANSFVTQVDLGIVSKLKTDLLEQGFEFSTPQYTVFSAKKKGITCTLYLSGKLMVQGKEMKEFIEFYLEPNILHHFHFTHKAIAPIDQTSRIGIDESGKGDYFGPLCIAGVFASGKQVTDLKSLGVCDSKTLTDATVQRLGPQIRKLCSHHIVRINPPKYNELYGQFQNLNKLLAWGHATTIEQLVLQTECRNVIIDQFADEKVVETALKRKKLELNLTQRHRAEEDVVVAAASILARYAFLEGLQKLKEQFGMQFPKGASKGTIDAGRRFVEKNGLGALNLVAKLHFKTTLLIT